MREMREKPKKEFEVLEGVYKLVPPLFSCPINDHRIPESERTGPPAGRHNVRIASVFFANSELITKTLFPSRSEDCLLAFFHGHEVCIHRYRGPFSLLNYDHFRLHKYYHDIPTALCFLTKPGDNTNCLAVGFHGGQIVFPKEGKIFNEQKVIDESHVTCIEGFPGYPHRWMASYASGNIYVFDENAEYGAVKPLYKVVKKGHLFTVSYNNPGYTCNPLYRWEIGKGPLHHFAFSNDERYMATVGEDGYLRVFEFEEMELIGYLRTFSGLLHCAWSPDSKLVAAAGCDTMITVYDVSRRAILLRCMGHTDSVSRVVFDPWVQTMDVEGLAPEEILHYRLCSVGHDRKMALWDIDDILITPREYEPYKTPEEDLPVNDEVSIAEDNSSWYLSSQSPRRFDFLAHVTNLCNRLRNFGRGIVANFRRTPPLFVDPFDYVGTPACPFIEDVYVVKPVAINVVAEEALTDVIVREDGYVIASMDGFICTWGRPFTHTPPEGFKVPHLKHWETCY